MESGNWVRIDKNAVSALPTDRPYSAPEALISLTVDYDNKALVSITGYAKLWGWNKKKVARFLQQIGVTIEYPEDTSKKRNQRGLIRYLIKSQSGSNKGLIQFKHFNGLQDEKDQSGSKEGLIKSQSRVCTIKTIETKTKTKKKSKPKKAAFDYRKFLSEKDVPVDLIDDWHQSFKDKKKSITKTQMKKLEEQVLQSGLSWRDVIEIMATKSWCTFEAKWLEGDRGRHYNTTAQQAQRERGVIC